jgi:hypothetical protein
VSTTLVIERANNRVNTVVEIVDQASAKLLHEAEILCTSYLVAHVLGPELLNLGIQEVVEDLLNAKSGQNMCLLDDNGVTTFAEAAARCSAKGYVAVGIRSAADVLLNPDESTTLNIDDKIISIEAFRVQDL